jgi:hypothetical protein
MMRECKFVNTSVPFLVATIDFVFEGCTFEAGGNPDAIALDMELPMYISVRNCAFIDLKKAVVDHAGGQYDTLQVCSSNFTNCGLGIETRVGVISVVDCIFPGATGSCIVIATPYNTPAVILGCTFPFVGSSPSISITDSHAIVQIRYCCFMNPYAISGAVSSYESSSVSLGPFVCFSGWQEAFTDVSIMEEDEVSFDCSDCQTDLVSDETAVCGMAAPPPPSTPPRSQSPPATNTPVPTASESPFPTASDSPFPTESDSPVPTVSDSPFPTQSETLMFTVSLRAYARPYQIIRGFFFTLAIGLV